MARLRAAGDYLQVRPDTTLHISAEKYVIENVHARQIRENAFDKIYGCNPQPYHVLS